MTTHAMFSKWTIFVLFGSKDHQSKPALPSSASDACHDGGLADQLRRPDARPDDGDFEPFVRRADQRLRLRVDDDVATLRKDHPGRGAALGWSPSGRTGWA